ncbi:SDR family oxidoreductase [Kibdelosporangium phytohabitans]|uniref:SDR family oxidoreductase n=1 Tax=Kibdelosporangium phytohabitans TaxID=860235 RepID=UPI000B10BA8E|nr:SDR family oxidoreductase [Kibdelosporangium phytohabitans]MBE1461045.1 NAD(P)-dependent dehydrogenase (short-subunit alcohol dehydrogenase family) [Kibdelosporangium phytohabitans]
MTPTALITGGASGIGAAVARHLLDRGYRVAVTGRDEARLAAFAAGTPALTIPGDAADWDCVRDAVAATEDRFGRLDAVVANAGYATHDDIEHGDPHGWRDMVLTNVLGPVLLIKAALPALKRTRGRIVLVGSVAGLIHTPGNIYGATKWAVTGLAENTRLQVTEYGVGVTLVSPGAVDTGFFTRIGGPPPRPGGYLPWNTWRRRSCGR